MVLRVLLVDDHRVLREGLEAALNALPDIAIVGSVGSGADALALLAKTHADVVVTDQSMPGMDGLQVVASIQRLYPETRCILLTMHEEAFLRAEAKRVGAHGLLPKSTSAEELARAIRLVAGGGTAFPLEATTTERGQDGVRLTPRERQVLNLIVRECSNVQIAEKLFISVQTVETHRKNIFRKTKAQSLVGLINFAHGNGLVEP